MGKDLMTNTTSYSELNSQYDGFIVPAKKITIDGTNIEADYNASITSVEVALKLNETSSACFDIFGIYDLESQSFDSGVKEKLKLGAIISVELGYGSALTEIFYGFIAEINMIYDETYYINVVALDVRRLIKSNYRRGKVYEKKTYSDIFKSIITEYSKAYKKISVDDTTGQLASVIQNSSDEDFILNTLCRESNSYFFVVAGVVYFKTTVTSNTSCILTFAPTDEGLYSFCKRYNYCSGSVALTGHIEVDKTDYQSKDTVKSDSKLVDLTKPQAILLTPDTIAKEEATAKKAIEYDVLLRKMESQAGFGSCVGLPDLVPGRYVEINNIDSEVNKKYFLTEVVHTFDGNGFKTDFSTGVWT